MSMTFARPDLEWPDRAYPIRVDTTLVTGVEPGFPFGIEEAREYAQQLLGAADAAEEARRESRRFVQVEFTNAGIRYTYACTPRDGLSVGDEVLVTGSHQSRVGRVVAFGRGDYTGTVYESVRAKVVNL